MEIPSNYTQFAPVSSTQDHNGPPLLRLIERNIPPAPEELVAAARQEAKESKERFFTTACPFPAFWARCDQLPPGQALDLGIRYFEPILMLPPHERQPSSYFDTTVADIAYTLGVKALGDTKSYIQLLLYSQRLQSLLSYSEGGRSKTLLFLNHPQQVWTPESRLVKAIAEGCSRSLLSFYAFVCHCNQQKLDGYSALQIARTYFNSMWSIRPDLCAASDLPCLIGGIIAIFGEYGINQCVVPQDFESLANEIHELSKSCIGCQEEAKKILTHRRPGPRTYLLKEMINGIGLTHLFQLVVQSLPDIFLTPEQWNTFGWRCLQLEPQSIRLWLSIGASGNDQQLFNIACQRVALLLNTTPPPPSSQYSSLLTRLIEKANEVAPPCAPYLRALGLKAGWIEETFTPSH